MRWIAALAAALLLAGLPAAADAAKRHKCSKRGSETVRSDSRGRVYVVKNQYDEWSYYGCLYRTGRRRILGTEGSYEGLDDLWRFVLRSPYVAYVETLPASGDVPQTLERTDLRSGRTVEVTNAAHETSLVDFVLTRFGAVAWLLETYGSHASGTYTDELVAKLDRDGRVTLDAGRDVGLDELAVSRSGHTLYWLHGGEPRSARLR